jgi:hypothetical protein
VLFWLNCTGNLGARWSARGETANLLSDRRLATAANYLPYSATFSTRRMLGTGGRHSIRFPRDSIICRAELRGDSAAATAPYDVALTRRLPEQCRSIGSGARATQRAVLHCAVNVKGVPAKPQYPLRGSDRGGASLVSHRHIMQPDPWHRKKCPLIW